MEHTKEPWVKFECEGDVFLQNAPSNVGIGKIYASENARRIVACVNACAGISTENLEKNILLIEAVRRMNAAVKQRDNAWEEGRKIRAVIKANPEESTFDEVERVVAQCDELLSALKNIVNWAGKRGGDKDYLLPSDFQLEEIQKAMILITKVEDES